MVGRGACVIMDGVPEDETTRDEILAALAWALDLDPARVTA